MLKNCYYQKIILVFFVFVFLVVVFGDNAKGAVNIIGGDGISQDLNIRKIDAGFEITVAKSEGLTHLARRVLKEYIKNNKEVLYDEQKIYAEDYLQKSESANILKILGRKKIKIGNKIFFSENSVKEAVEASKKLTFSRMENLRKYVVRISNFENTNPFEIINKELSNIKGLNPLEMGKQGKEDQDTFSSELKKNLENYNKNTDNPLGTVVDIDGNIYNIIKISNQYWMKENLKVTKNPAGKAITRYCYNNDPKICDTDGGLYDWNTAMNNSTIEGVQGICPNGWHIPKDSEWYVLENGLKDAGQECDSARQGRYNCDTAGVKLKINGSTGFDSVFAGYRFNLRQGFYSRGQNAFFWSSTEKGSYAWERTINSSLSEIARGSNVKIDAFSIRCLKD